MTVTAAGVVPFAFVAYTTHPFVATIHVRLPPFVRGSRQMLERWARTVSSSTSPGSGPSAAARPQPQVEITTMGLLGRPRLSIFNLGELRFVGKEGKGRARLGLANYVRNQSPAQEQAEEARRRWYQRREATGFMVDDDSKHAKEGWVWREMARGIRRRSG